MKEIEVKVFNVDFKDLRKKLKVLKAKHIGKKPSCDTLFTNAKLKKERRTLRLREIDNKIILTYKGKKAKSKQYKSREEIEVDISDLANIKKILKELGYKIFIIIRKEVDYYKLNSVSVELTKIKKIPLYVELEGSVKNIDLVAKKLGISKKGFSAITKSQLVNKYWK